MMTVVVVRGQNQSLKAMAVLYILSKIDSTRREEDSYPIQCFKNKAQAVQAFNEAKEEFLQRLLSEKRPDKHSKGIYCLEWDDDSDERNLTRTAQRMRYTISYKRHVKSEFSWGTIQHVTEGYRLDRVPYQPKPQEQSKQ